MIQVTHDNVLKINGIVSSINLSEEEIDQLNEFKKIRFAVLDYSNAQFGLLLKDVIFKLQESYKIYLIYIESKPQPKNRVRSYKKMFFGEKQKPVFRQGDIREIEIEVSDNTSLLVSSIRLTESNRTYVLENLINSNFKFGYFVKKGKKSFNKNISSFLENITSLLTDRSTISRMNYIQLLLSEVKKNKNIFRIPSSVNDKEYLEFLIRRDDKEVTEKLLGLENRYKEVMGN